ncbi:MAG: cytochrome c biogenesis protein CcmG/thiol:disulfide interchange protein DsbE [Arenicella sp.]
MGIVAQSNKKNLAYIVPLIAFITVAVFLGVGLTLNPRDLPSTRINKPAPTFDLELLRERGSNFSPEDFLGRRWILNTWASWCVGCRVEHPLLMQLARQTDIPMVGLNYKDDPDKAQLWLSERGDPYIKIPMDIAGNAGIDWGVYGVPETFVIDENGIVIYKHTGPITAQAVQQKILPLFNKK